MVQPQLEPSCSYTLQHICLIWRTDKPDKPQVAQFHQVDGEDKQGGNVYCIEFTCVSSPSTSQTHDSIDSQGSPDPSVSLLCCLFSLEHVELQTLSVSFCPQSPQSLGPPSFLSKVIFEHSEPIASCSCLSGEYEYSWLRSVKFVESRRDGPIPCCMPTSNWGSRHVEATFINCRNT